MSVFEDTNPRDMKELLRQINTRAAALPDIQDHGRGPRTRPFAGADSSMSGEDSLTATQQETKMASGVSSPRVTELRFAAGPMPNSAGLKIATSSVVVFVGPNNAGKSLALRDIEAWCSGEEATGTVIAAMDASLPGTSDEALKLLRRVATDPPDGQFDSPNRLWVPIHTFARGATFRNQQVDLAALAIWITQKEPGASRAVRSMLVRTYTVRLDGRTRFALAEEQPSEDLLASPRNHLAALWQNDDARTRVRRMTAEALDGLHFVIDRLKGSHFRPRMSRRAPLTSMEEQSLDAAARAFHSEAIPLSELSDGVQAFTGLTAAVVGLHHTILLIDEPEAFLHPPLARRLGTNLATLATERNASLFTATHSADFVMGCLESGSPTTIVRLTYQGGIATARALDTEQLRPLLRDPLLRSTGALRGLFHRAVVVSEADRDRAFYDEINRRLQAVRDTPRGLDDALFLNAQNWQTVPRVAGPLRQLGIPAVAIIDLDALAADGPWADYYEMMALDEGVRSALDSRRIACAARMRALSKTADGIRPYKKLGLAGLPADLHTDVEDIVTLFADYGVFLVEVGEVEGWLRPDVRNLGKKDWLEAVFEYLGSDPADPAYVSPFEGDVWAFLDRVAAWVKNPFRKGIPA